VSFPLCLFRVPSHSTTPHLAVCNPYLDESLISYTGHHCRLYRGGRNVAARKSEEPGSMTQTHNKALFLQQHFFHATTTIGRTSRIKGYS
jgi:hypothetical protein